MTPEPAGGRLPAGAVGTVVLGQRSPAAARHALSASFAADPSVVVDGALVLGWAPGPNRVVHVSDAVVCLVEGALYETAGYGADASTSATEPLATSAELLARAWRQRGEAALRPLRGDFWTLLWDRHRQRGIVAGDQMGGRTPFWSTADGDVVFASELSDLLAALPSRPGPDEVAMAHWLARTIAPDGRSFFSGVRRLAGGQLLEIGERTPTARRYWSPSYQGVLRAPREELVEQLRTGLGRAVERRLSGVPGAGILLSGGLDSSVVAGLAAQWSTGAGAGQGQPLLEAYSATFPDHPDIDESRYIDATTAGLGIGSTRIRVPGGGVLGGALAYLGTWSVPPTSPNMFFWVPLLGRAADDGMAVMLDGEGGDELFGLAPYVLADRLRAGRVASAVRLAASFPGSARPANRARVWRLLRRYGLKGAAPPFAHRAARRLRGAQRYAPELLHPATTRAWLDTERSYAWKRLAGPRWWAYLVDAVTQGNGPMLVYEQARRRAAMVGLEARHPLVDLDVVDLMLRLPPEMAFDRRHSRPLLRQAVAGALPDEVRLRPSKSSFDTIFHAGLVSHDLAVVRELLGTPDALVGSYVDLAAVRRDLLDPGPPRPAALQHWALTVWRLVTAECWLRQQDDTRFASDLGERLKSARPFEIVRQTRHPFPTFARKRDEG
jgi:asparagine synthase (glutamine-hydrolysing)